MQQQLCSATEGHKRETAQLQAQLRQSRGDQERDAQELETVREELQRLKERHDDERERLSRRQDGLLKVPGRQCNCTVARTLPQPVRQACQRALKSRPADWGVKASEMKSFHSLL